MHQLGMEPHPFFFQLLVLRRLDFLKSNEPAMSFVVSMINLRFFDALASLKPSLFQPLMLRYSAL